jgi:hypothetical protein
MFAAENRKNIRCTTADVPLSENRKKDDKPDMVAREGLGQGCSFAWQQSINLLERLLFPVTVLFLA